MEDSFVQNLQAKIGRRQVDVVTGGHGDTFSFKLKKGRRTSSSPKANKYH